MDVRCWPSLAAIERVKPRLARSTFTGTGEPGSDDAASTQVAARVTSTVCGEPPSRMKVTVTVVSGG